MASSHYRRLIQALFFALFFYQCSAQLGTEITYPLSNDTITPGQKLDILYHYQNMGNGSYTIDVDLNSTYAWTVPKGLNETVYLTITTKPQLESKLDLSMRSRPIVLHVNAGIINMPIQKLGLTLNNKIILFPNDKCL